MAKKIEVIGQAVVITDTGSGSIDFDAPKSEYYYKVESLIKDNIVELYNLDYSDTLLSRPNKIKLSDAVDESGTPFTVESFQTFARGSLGFNEGGGSGSSGAAGTGWAYYTDSVYTEASPLVVSQGTEAVIRLNGNTTIKSQLPDGVTDFYDVVSGKITPDKVGDGYSFSVGFQAKSSSNNGDFTLSIDIGTPVGKIFPKVLRLPRGSGQEHDFYVTMQGYSLSTFVTNGGEITIGSGAGQTSLYNIVLQIHRTHKAI